MVNQLSRTTLKTSRYATSVGSGFSRIGLAIAVAISGLISLPQPGLSLSEDEAYTLCSRYPHNAQCEGYDIPIPLSRRAGETGMCALNAGTVALADRCKVSIEGDMVNAYVEQGDEIEMMEGARRTTEFAFSVSNINTLSYAESESVDKDKLITNTLLWGVWGALATRPDKVSQIEIRFAETGEMPASAVDMTSAELIAPAIADGETTATNVTTAPETSAVAVAEAAGSLVFETDRSDGRSLRDNLQEMTGLTPRTSL